MRYINKIFIELFFHHQTPGNIMSSRCQLLHSFTQRPTSPCTVLCAIHQPRSSVFHLFSSVLVLSRGATLYFGPPSKLVMHFQSLSGLPVDDFTRCRCD